MPGGTVALIEVEVTEETAADALPTVTLAPATKFAPAMFTLVPPVVGPELGVTEVTLTGGGGVEDGDRAKLWVTVAPAVRLTVAEEVA